MSLEISQYVVSRLQVCDHGCSDGACAANSETSMLGSDVEMHC